MSKMKSMSKSKKIGDSISYVVLLVLATIWILPILWIVMTSLTPGATLTTKHFLPDSLTLDNYKKLFTDTEQFYFLRWFLNTLLVAICSCIISTIFVLFTSYTMSRLRFKARKPLLNIALVLGMFPGFMSMIAIYYILKSFGISRSLLALVLVYSGGSGLGFYIAKGFFDTIPIAIDEAARIDGATRWQVFTKLIIPFSKPTIIYTILTSFIAPWVDYIFASVIMGDKYNNYTVALGLYKMLEREFITVWYGRFAAGAVIVSIPISLLFIVMQKYYVGGVTGGSVKG